MTKDNDNEVEEVEIDDVEIEALIDGNSIMQYMEGIGNLVPTLGLLWETRNLFATPDGKGMDPAWGDRLTLCLITLAELAFRAENVCLRWCSRESLRELAESYHPGGVQLIVPECFWTDNHVNCPHSNV